MFVIHDCYTAIISTCSLFIIQQKNRKEECLLKNFGRQTKPIKFDLTVPFFSFQNLLSLPKMETKNKNKMSWTQEVHWIGHSEDVHKMAKHTQTIHLQFAVCLSMSDHFVDVFQTFDVHSIYVLCPGGNQQGSTVNNFTYKKLMMHEQI